jgi:hypothetical protein
MYRLKEGRRYRSAVAERRREFELGSRAEGRRIKGGIPAGLRHLGRFRDYRARFVGVEP